MSFPVDRSSYHAFGCLILLVLSACNRATPPAPKPDVAKTEPAVARAVRFVKLEEVSEWSGKPWAAVAELGLIDVNGAAVDRTRWTATADSSGAIDVPQNAIDGDPKSLWHSRWEGPDPAPPPPHWLVVALGAPVKVSGFRYLPRQDGTTANGAIAKYRFYVSDDGQSWGEPVSTGDFTAMGDAVAEKTVVFAKQTANHAPVVASIADQTTTMGQSVSLRVDATDEDADRLTFVATGLPTGLAIDPSSGVIAGTPIVPGSYKVRVGVADGKGEPTTTAWQWTVPAAVGEAESTKLAPGEIRFVRLEEVTEIGGNAWASIAEFNLIDANGSNLPRTGWSASADSAAINDQPSNAIDGLPTTVWHSRWEGVPPPPPHSFIVDLKQGTRIAGFRYLPRQDGLPNGTIARFRFFTSVDGVDWGKPVAEGDFSTMGPPGAEKTVRFKQ